MRLAEAGKDLAEIVDAIDGAVDREAGEGDATRRRGPVLGVNRLEVEPVDQQRRDQAGRQPQAGARTAAIAAAPGASTSDRRQ